MDNNSNNEIHQQDIGIYEGPSYGADIGIVKEEENLVLTFETQKKLNRELENMLQAREESWRLERLEWQKQLENLQQEISQSLHDIKLKISDQTQTKLLGQIEIAKLLSANEAIRNKTKFIECEYERVRNERYILAKRLRDVGLSDSVEGTTDSSNVSSIHGANASNIPAKEEQNYKGILEFRIEDIDVIIHQLFELKPRIALTLVPNLPSYIIFMCIRHIDSINDKDSVPLLMDKFVETVESVIEEHNNFDYKVLWLSNTLKLSDIMKQYSGEIPYKVINSKRENEQCLKNINPIVSKYDDQLKQVAVEMFNSIIANIKERILTFVVPALLEHEATDVPAPNEDASSFVDDELDKLLNELSLVHTTLQIYGVEFEVIMQMFQRIFYFICGHTINHLLTRNELCRWTKGKQIRYNISRLEQWCAQKLMVCVPVTLEPIIQASQLLQAHKTDENINSICEMCDQLRANQIVKLLDMYSPEENDESSISVSFINKIEDKLKERGENNGQLEMNTDYPCDVQFVCNLSYKRLEDIEVPELLQLPMLKKI